MSKLSDLIFHGKDNYITSPFGKRAVLSTSKGNTSSFHNGVDYGTNNLKIAQYAIENGVILSCGTDYGYGGAKYVWVKYPRLGVKMLHYHLDSIKVKAGQTVNENTILGYTGKTGRATGIHLHLGLKLLSGGDYIDPEAWFKKYYKEPTKVPTNKTNSFLPARGYFTIGDSGDNIKKINDFYYNVFPAYAKTLKRNKKNLKGKLFGENTQAWTKEFQKNTGLKPDGNIGPLTLAKMVEFGFKY